MPENPYVIHEGNLDVPFRHGMVDYEFQDKLSRHFARQHGTTAVMVGLRADESLNRYAAVARGNKRRSYQGRKWITQTDAVTVNAYPLYDWRVSDIWTPTPVLVLTTTAFMTFCTTRASLPGKCGWPAPSMIVPRKA